MQVIGFEHCSGFHVSAAEAAMMLAKPEYVTVYEVLLSDEDMDNNISELTVGLDTIGLLRNDLPVQQDMYADVSFQVFSALSCLQPFWE